MNVKYSEIASNFRKVTIGTGGYLLILYFSYETIVGFTLSSDRSCENFHKTYCIKNQWGPATGKHLNQIESDKTKRLDEENFQEELGKALGGFRHV